MNLLTDLKEERDVGVKASWVGTPMTKTCAVLDAGFKLTHYEGVCRVAGYAERS
jgi:hypothetical protein